MDKVKVEKIEDFSVGGLRRLYQSSDFDSAFNKLISRNVIQILSPQKVLKHHNLVYDEELVYNELIGPLERYSLDLPDYAEQSTVDETMELLQLHYNRSDKVCRRVLKPGDVTFSCNDCGLDGTCVVCIDCFHKSAHKDHNYRMYNSEGGCCDCGDIEAWKQHYACIDHSTPNKASLTLSDYEDKELRSKQIKEDQSNIVNRIMSLPSKIGTKYFLVCQASLHYARMLLTWDNYHSLPQHLEDETMTGSTIINDPVLDLLSKEHTSKNYCTVLFNDEVHTYDHVISTLVKVIHCTKMTASIMASTVSREGRSLIINDDYKSCKQVKDMIANIRDPSQGPLKVEIIHGAVLAHQAFALKLIEWIRKMSSTCDVFRTITAYTLLGTFDPIPNRESESSDMTLVEKVMLSNTAFWKIARVEWNDLFVTTMLTEYSIKAEFARLLTRIYPKLMHDFIQDDHDHSVSILTLTTQLYTVPSLICMLIEEENALAIIAQTLIDTCKSIKRDNPAMSYENRNSFDLHGLRRGFYTISDLRNLINIQPTKWTDGLKNNVIEAVKIFLNLLTHMQGMDSVRRQLGQHLEYEPEWESGMTLQNRLIHFISRLVTYCSFNEDVLVASLKETQSRLLKSGGYKMITRELFGHPVACIQYDVSTSPVSVHLPLTRFAASLIVELMKRRPCDRLPYDESLVILTDRGDCRPKQSMIEIMEPSLRTEVMIAQFRSGMWRRNGYSLVNQIMYFHGPAMRKEMFDRDILVLQECAAMCPANEFMIHMLNKFQLFTWISSETTRAPLVGPKAVSFHNDEEIMAQTMSLGEEFLQLLLTIIGERYRVGVGMIEEEDVIKNEIIQLLCISPSTRSDVTQKLYALDNELDCIKSVANLRRSTEASTGKYELKSEFYERFNPFFYHYSRRHQSNALDAQLKRKKNLKESLVCCPPPAPVELTKQFKNLNELLKCDISLILIKKILTRTLDPKDGIQECSTKAPIRFVASDLQLDQCLHLIGLGIYEQERNPIDFKFLQAAHDKDIFMLLKECYEKPKRSKDLIFWLMKKTNDLVENLSNNYYNSIDDVTKSKIESIRECFKSTLSACDTTKQDSKKRNSELAAQRRDRIMSMMKANQDKFLSNPSTKQLVAETEKNEFKPQTQQSRQLQQQPQTQASNSTSNLSPYNSASSSTQQQSIYTTRSGRRTKPPKTFSASTGKVSTPQDKGLFPFEQSTTTNQGTSNASCEDGMDYESEDEQISSESIKMDEDTDLREPPETSHLCILCRDEQKISFNQPTMVLLAYIQRSSVLSKNRSIRRIPNYTLTPSYHLKHQSLYQLFNMKMRNVPDYYSYTTDNSWSFDATFMPSDLFFGPHISTCGHVMHYECWQGFFNAIMNRETSRPSRNARHVSFELEKHEILCPLCECISNATIPLLPNYTRFAMNRKLPGPLDTLFGTSQESIVRSPENLSAFLHALSGAVGISNHIRHIKEVKPMNMVVELDDKYIRLIQPKDINDALEGMNEVEALGLRDFLNSVRVDKISSSSCTKNLLCSITTLAERIHSVGLDLDRSVTDVNHARVFMMTTWSISYTIQALERSTRFKGVPLFEDLESSRNSCLTLLLRFSCCSMLTHQSDMMQSLLIRKLRYLLINEEHLSASPCCLDLDVLETFVSLFLLLQKLYAHVDDIGKLNPPSNKSNEQSTHPGSPLNVSTSSSTSSKCDNSTNYAWTTRAFDHEYYRNLLHLMVILNLVQVIITLQNESQNLEGGQDEGNSSKSDSQHTQYSDSNREFQLLYEFYQEIVIAAGHPNSRMPDINDKFSTKLKGRLLPFLRASSLFLFHISNIQPPEILRTKSAFFDGKEYLSYEDFEQCKADINCEAINNEFNSICYYLNLPTDLSLLIKSHGASNLVRGAWLKHPRVLELIKSALKERETASVAAESSSAKGSSSSNRKSSLKRGQSFTSTSSQKEGESGNPSSCSPPSNSSSSSASKLPSKSSSAASISTSGPFKISKSELMPVSFVRQPHSVNRLIDLPYDYSELVDRVSDFTCPSIKYEDSRTPTMCLVCGVMLCSQSYCCQRDLNNLASNYEEFIKCLMEHTRQGSFSATSSSSSDLLHQHNLNQASGGGAHVAGNPMMPPNAFAALSLMGGSFLSITPTNGTWLLPNNPSSSSSSGAAAASAASSIIHQQLVGSCTYHAYECSGGVGVFLRIRNCQILLLSGRSKGCYMPAPYIDDHGETDFGLMRGNPLHLNRQHYEKLQQMWLTHAIPEQISRTLEYSPYASQINWHLH